jgi:hypothetical protein
VTPGPARGIGFHPSAEVQVAPGRSGSGPLPNPVVGIVPMHAAEDGHGRVAIADLVTEG